MIRAKRIILSDLQSISQMHKNNFFSISVNSLSTKRRWDEERYIFNSSTILEYTRAQDKVLQQILRITFVSPFLLLTIRLDPLIAGELQQEEEEEEINTTIIRKYSRAFAILYSRKSIGKFIIYANRATTNS